MAMGHSMQDGAWRVAWEDADARRKCAPVLSPVASVCDAVSTKKVVGERPKGWHAMYLNYEHERGGQPEYSLTTD
jgi:hypothetical protein